MFTIPAVFFTVNTATPTIQVARLSIFSRIAFGASSGLSIAVVGGVSVQTVEETVTTAGHIALVPVPTTVTRDTNVRGRVTVLAKV